MKTLQRTLLALRLLLALAQGVRAATLTVTSAADSGAGTLRNTISGAASGNTITFDNPLSGQTIRFASGIALTRSFIIDASGLSGGIILRGKADQGAAGNFNLFRVTGAGNLTLSNLTLAQDGGTSLPDNGGAIFNYTAAATLSLITHFTLTSNTCAADFSGAVCNDSGSVAVTHCTISSNSAPAGNGAGGGLFNFNGRSPSPTASSLATFPPQAPRTLTTTTRSRLGGANLVQFISGGYAGPNSIAAAPLLAPLDNYGGPTQTMPPLPGSPAIDAGAATTLTTYQRGFPRVVGAAVDIGAVEVQTILAGSQPRLVNAKTLSNNSFQFGFTNTPAASLPVWASTKVALPFAQWSNLGAPVESPLGTFTFTDPQATNSPQRFYRVTSPYRVPVARLAAAQAAIEEKRKAKARKKKLLAPMNHQPLRETGAAFGSQ